VSGLSRRAFLASGTAAAGLAASPALALPSTEQQLNGLYDKLWQDTLRRSPQLATSYAVDSGEHASARARLDDASRGGREDWISWASSAAKKLEAIDPSLLPNAQVVNRAVLLDYYSKAAGLGRKWQFGDGATSPDAPVTPYVVSQQGGAYLAVPELLAERHRVATSADAEAWVARVAGFAKALDDNTEAMRIDAGAGIVAPAFALDAALAQMGRLRTGSGAESMLATGLARKAAAAGLAGDWATKAAAMVERMVHPALDRQIAVATALRERSGNDAGVWKLRNGREYYADALAWQTSAAITPAEVHRLGLNEVAEITAEMDGLLRGLGLTGGTVGARVKALGAQPGQAFAATDAGRAEALKVFADAIAKVRPHLAEQFSLLPPAPLDVRRAAPEAEQDPALVFAQGGSLDGTRPGTLYVNLADLAEWPRYSIATAAFQEGIPGHLWEAATANANPDLPAVRKRGVRYGAYAEGWGLYAEQVADEMGLYADDPASRVGYLRAQLFRSARLVMDSGIHDLGWSREKAVAYMVETTGQSDNAMRREVDRCAVAPGQACSYKVGQMEWLRLRTLAKRLAGPSFDVRRFHSLIAQGRAPFSVMEEVVTQTFQKKLSVLAARTV
jgi:uncharacterized protein (DUF885 family)